MDHPGVNGYHEHETRLAEVPLAPRPMKSPLEATNRIQDLKDTRAKEDVEYARRLFDSIVMARNAPAYAASSWEAGRRTARRQGWRC